MLTEGQSQQTLIKSHLDNTYLQRPRGSKRKLLVNLSRLIRKSRLISVKMFNATLAGNTRHGRSGGGSRTSSRTGSLAGSRRGSRDDVFNDSGMPSNLLKVYKYF